MLGLLPLSNSEIDNALNSNRDLVLPPSANAFLISLRAMRKSVLVITASSRAAEELAKEIRECHIDTLEFPAWETLPHERLSPSSDTVAKRIFTLQALKDQTRNWVVVAPVRAVIHKFNTQIVKTEPISIARGMEIDFTSLQRELIKFAYVRTDLVERRGEFAVRGGILDIFPPDQDHPIRIDFFGDEIEEISYFAVADQRTTDQVTRAIRILPCRELLITDEIREKAKNLLEQFENEMLQKISQGIQPEGTESLIPVLVDELQLISSLMPEGFESMFIEKERVSSRLSDLLATNQELYEAPWSSAAVGGKAPINIGSTYIDLDELLENLPRYRDLRQFGSDNDVFLDIRGIEPFKGNLDRLIAELEVAVNEKRKVVFSASSKGMIERYAGIFRDSELPVQIQFPLKAAPTSGYVNVTASSFRNGFSDDQILFITERDLTGTQSGANERLPSKRKKSIDPLQLRSGDYVVHEQHGIGRYVEMAQRSVGGVVREYIVIEYAPAKRGQPGDRIFVPTDGLDQISKYVGGETPTVHRIGSGDWSKAKSRARRAVREIAGELIRLYAARRSAPGFAFSPDTPWQRDLEDNFAYVETADQISTIEEVKRDMESPYPMDLSLIHI